MTADLICEGSCNPTLGMLDVHVRNAREGMPERWALTDRDLIGKLRALKHTTHVKVAPARYQCAACGTERRY